MWPCFRYSFYCGYGWRPNFQRSKVLSSNLSILEKKKITFFPESLKRLSYLIYLFILGNLFKNKIRQKKKN